MIILEGRAPQPVYLWIENEQAELRPASEFIWGQTFWDAETALKARHGQAIKVAGIGQAGEALVRYACVMNDTDRAAGRSGVGAVMGSKKIKAIAVRGSLGVSVDDPATFTEAVKIGHDKLARSPARKRQTTFGTTAMMSKTHHFGALPTRNCLDVQFEGADKIGAEAMRTSPGRGRKPNLVTNKACFGCTIGCARMARIQPDHFTLKAGERYGQVQGGLEYESAYSLGAMVGVDDLDALTFANMVCNEQGMDPISFGVTLAAAMELFENGVIGLTETDGTELRFGSTEALAEMVQAAGAHRGFGEDLGLGARRLCEKYGRPELAMAVKGQEFPGYDPRGMQGMGLAYATSNRGACHLRADPFGSDFTTADPTPKAKIVKDSQDENAAIDSMGICAFTMSSWRFDDIQRQLDAACAGDWSIARLLEMGERIWNLERRFNLAAGLSGADDTLPPRMLKDAAKSGVNRGEVSHLDVMLPAYYELRGWSADGVPSNETLARLDL